MSDPIVVPRSDLSRPGLLGWGYQTSTDPTLKSDRVFIRCSNGHIGSILPATHTISDDGTVSPSLVCEQCLFHGTVRLDGWPPPGEGGGMRLALLDPSFIRLEGAGSGRVGSAAEAQGIDFQCPGCASNCQYGPNSGEPDGVGYRGVHYVRCWFAGRNVPDEIDPKPGRWSVTGSSFEDLSLSPSILLQGGCNWHGWITNGEAT